MGRRWLAVAFAVLVVVAGVTVHLVDRARDHEWAHGGDALSVEVELRLVDAAAFGETALALGARPDQNLSLPPEFQAIVARVTWTGSPVEGGSFQFVALDARPIPPRPLNGGGGWHSTGQTGSHWASAYEPLSVRYDWLAGTADTPLTAAVDVPATRAGQATVYFYAQPEGRRLGGREDVIIALFYVDPDGEVRWARRIHG